MRQNFEEIMGKRPKGILVYLPGLLGDIQRAFEENHQVLMHDTSLLKTGMNHAPIKTLDDPPEGLKASPVQKRTKEVDMSYFIKSPALVVETAKELTYQYTTTAKGQPITKVASRNVQIGSSLMLPLAWYHAMGLTDEELPLWAVQEPNPINGWSAEDICTSLCRVRLLGHDISMGLKGDLQKFKSIDDVFSVYEGHVFDEYRTWGCKPRKGGTQMYYQVPALEVSRPAYVWGAKGTHPLQFRDL